MKKIVLTIALGLGLLVSIFDLNGKLILSPIIDTTNSLKTKFIYPRNLLVVNEYKRIL